MNKEIAYIALGSNLDQPEDHIRQAFGQLQCLPQSQLIQTSSLYRSKPWGELTSMQPDYINAVVKLETTLSPSVLLQQLLDLEKLHHRVRTQRWAPRTLDCDIILYGQHTLNRPELTVPHAHMASRLFVLLPLFEIDPHLMLPNGTLVRDLLNPYDKSSIQKLPSAQNEYEESNR